MRCSSAPASSRPADSVARWLSGGPDPRAVGVEHDTTTGGTWQVPGNTSHVHPRNIGPAPLVTRQTIDADIDGLALGVERYFETIMALAQRGETDEKFDIRSPLQSAPRGPCRAAPRSRPLSRSALTL